MPAKAMTDERIRERAGALNLEFAQAPIKPKGAAPRQTGTATFQSILPRRANSHVPAAPVNMNVNKAVAMAFWITSPPSRSSAGISRMPPTETAPISTPTPSETASNQSTMALACGECGQSARDQKIELLHHLEAQGIVVFHQIEKFVAVDCQDATRGQAGRRCDAVFGRWRQRRPAEHVAAAQHVPG